MFVREWPRASSPHRRVAVVTQALLLLERTVSEELKTTGHGGCLWVGMRSRPPRTGDIQAPPGSRTHRARHRPSNEKRIAGFILHGLTGCPDSQTVPGRQHIDCESDSRTFSRSRPALCMCSRGPERTNLDAMRYIHFACVIGNKQRTLSS